MSVRLGVSALALVATALSSPLPAQEAIAADDRQIDLAGDVATTAADPATIFVEANAAYEAGNYAAAVAAYEQLIQRGLGSGRVHFNLGNAYLRNGELGRAIAALRRSLERLPRDEDVLANLTFARRSARDAIAPPGASVVMSTLFFWHYRLSRIELALIVLGLNLLFWLAAVGRLFRPQSEVLRWLAIVLLIGVLTTAGSLIIRQLWPSSVAVVVPQEIDAFTAPTADSVVRFKLHSGTEVRIKDEREGWLRIVLPDGEQAWIEAAWVELVAG